MNILLYDSFYFSVQNHKYGTVIINTKIMRMPYTLLILGLIINDNFPNS